MTVISWTASCLRMPRSGSSARAEIAKARQKKTAFITVGITFTSMAKVSSAGEDHGHAAFVGGGDDVGIADGAARLDGRCRAGFGGGNETIGEGEEGVAANYAAVEGEGGFGGFPNGDTAGI